MGLESWIRWADKQICLGPIVIVPKRTPFTEAVLVSDARLAYCRLQAGFFTLFIRLNWLRSLLLVLGSKLATSRGLSYSDFLNVELGFSVYGSSLLLLYGPQPNGWVDNPQKRFLSSFEIPFLVRRTTKVSILDNQGEVTYRIAIPSLPDWKTIDQLLHSAQEEVKVEHTIVRKNLTELKAITSMAEYHIGLGVGKFAWLSSVIKPKRARELHVMFSEPIEKGIIQVVVNAQDGETQRAALARYCNDRNLTLL